MASPATGRANTYPRGQCTWWAAERYYELHALFPPSWGNASAWLSGAQRDGWTVSSSPIDKSIICLQPGVQGANILFGHVGIVENVIDSSHVDTSDQNWAGITYPNFTHVTFQTGPGVSFLSAVGKGAPVPVNPNDVCLSCGPKGSDAYNQCLAAMAAGILPDCAKAAQNAATAKQNQDLQNAVLGQVQQVLSIDPMRVVKGVLGVALIIAGLALMVKAVVPPQAIAAIGG